jgi:hypothetical protein
MEKTIYRDVNNFLHSEKVLCTSVSLFLQVETIFFILPNQKKTPQKAQKSHKSFYEIKT